MILQVSSEGHNSAVLNEEIFSEVFEFLKHLSGVDDTVIHS